MRREGWTVTSEPTPRYPHGPYRSGEPDHERRAIVIRLYEKGLSAAQVGEVVGITRQAVLRMLKRAKVPRRSRGGNQGGHSRHRK